MILIRISHINSLLEKYLTALKKFQKESFKDLSFGRNKSRNLSHQNLKDLW